MFDYHRLINLLLYFVNLYLDTGDFITPGTRDKRLCSPGRLASFSYSFPPSRIPDVNVYYDVESGFMSSVRNQFCLDIRMLVCCACAQAGTAEDAEAIIRVVFSLAVGAQ